MRVKTEFGRVKRFGFATGAVLTTGIMMLLFSAAIGYGYTEIEVGGKPLLITGYLNQGVSVGIAGDEFDTKENFQSAITQLLVETEYNPSPATKIFVSGKLNVDWAYGINDHNGEWNDKGFDKSDDKLYLLDDWDDFLNEAHITWSPSNFLFRVGKQIVSWGETEGFRLMDQINPLDQRRGISDVEFETTIIPIVLFRGEYTMPTVSTVFQDLTFQFVFNPNADFRGDKGIVPGNDRSGIWAPHVTIPLGGPFPTDFAYLGSFDENIKEPDNWDPDGYEYGFRMSALVWDSILTLNYFYGRDNVPVSTVEPLPPRMEVNAWDNRMVLHLPSVGFYPRFKFAGATFSTDLYWLKAKFLGDVSPVIRLETFYAFDSTFGTAINTLEKKDELRWAIGVDWKVRIPVLNEKAFFFISPQFYHRKIIDYPDGFDLAGLEDDNYQTSLTLTTTYFRARLRPVFFWMRDITTESNLFKIQAQWEQSHRWNYTLGVLLIDGEKTGLGFEPLENKDQIYFTVAYKF